MRFSSAVVLAVIGCSPLGHSFTQPLYRKQSIHSKSAFVRRSTTEDVSSKVILEEFSKKIINGKYPVQPKQKTKGTTLNHATPEAARDHALSYLSQFKGQNGAHIVYSQLQQHGVTVVNGFSGGAVLPLLDQFSLEHPRHAENKEKVPIRWITNSNESSAGHIAEGYAKSIPITEDTNAPLGVVVATSGPGVTNLITPLQDALCDGVPILVLCGQAATTAPTDAFQSSPAVDLTRPCTKWSYQVKSAAEIPMAMEYAMYISSHGRPGPVFLDLPKDLQNQVVTDEMIQDFVETMGKEDSFLRMEVNHRLDGQKFHAFHMGYQEQGLPFEIVKGQDESFSLSPVTYKIAADDANMYHADHHPTNTLHLNNDEGGKVTGKFNAKDPMAHDLLKLIQRAKKPIIVAGQGCNDAPEELKTFAETLQIPVTTTLHALGCFDERHELALNMLGMHGHPTPNYMVQESDLVICIGSRFDDRITGRMSDFVPEARKAAAEGRGGIVHVDIRITEHKKQVAPTYFCHSTGKNFLRTLNEILASDAQKPVTGPWLEHKRELQTNFPVKIPSFPTVKVSCKNAAGEEVMESATKISAQSVIAEMDRQLLAKGRMDDAIFTTGVGVHQMVAAQLITWTQPRQMLSSGSLGTMGVSLGYSIGAKLANGRKIVISVDGDGSFNMTFTELKTLAEQKIAVKILLLDNEGQMMVEYWQRLFHDNRLLAVRNSHNPEYTTLAKAFGIKSIYCDRQEDLEEKMKEFLFAVPDEPVLFHLRIERTPCLPLVAPGQPLEDMILEDIEVEVDPSAAPS